MGEGSACSTTGGVCHAGLCSESPDAAGQPDAPLVGSGGMLGTGGTSGTIGTGGVTGSGGMVGTGGAVDSGGVIGTGGAIACGALIDDMEADTGRICQGNGRTGFWYTYVDTTVTSSISPPPHSPALPEPIAPPRVSSTSLFAMHASGTYSVYAGIACWLNKTTFSGPTGTFDAIGYTGISFWAKGTPGLKVGGQMPSTEAAANGGTCLTRTCVGNTSAIVGLSATTWTQFFVPFSSLTGGNATPFDPTAIWSIEFLPYNRTGRPPVTFDLWIDDLTFY